MVRQEEEEDNNNNHNDTEDVVDDDADDADNADDGGVEVDPNVEIMLNVTASKTYESEYKRYKKWLEGKQKTAVDGKWLTRENINFYYKHHVANERNAQTNTIKRIGAALQWFASYREHPLQDFVVVDSECKGYEKVAAFRNKGTTTPREGRKVTDPHAGLKDGMCEDDRLDVMKHIYKERNDYADCAFSHLWGMNAAVRGASSLKFVYILIS